MGQKNLSTSRDKNNHATSSDTQSLQPLGTKNHATSWDNKTKLSNFSGQKRSCNHRGQKNDETSRDKKIMPHLGIKKEVRNLSVPKKIAQPLRTKKMHASS